MVSALQPFARQLGHAPGLGVAPFDFVLPLELARTAERLLVEVEKHR
jgi:hypothetical protein